MPLTTCKLSDGRVIGWANVASFAKFRNWIDDRMANGFTYLIGEAKSVSFQVIFNNATKINYGVSPQQAFAIMREMDHDFLTSGDISIVRFDKEISQYRMMAETAQQVLENHTLEIPPQITQ